MALSWDIGALINLAEFALALMLIKSSFAIEKAFDNERSTKSCCNCLWYCCLNPKINLNVDAVLQLKRPLCSFATSWKALHVLFELKQHAECRSRAAEKLVVFAERESRVADKSGSADGSRAASMIELADGSRAAGKVELANGSRAAGKVELANGSWATGKVFWELLVAAIVCSAKDSSSDFLPWHSPRWELLVAAIGCSVKDSSTDFLPWHSPHWELLVAAIGCSSKDSRSDFLQWHSPRWELSVAAMGCSAKDSSSDFYRGIARKVE